MNSDICNNIQHEREHANDKEQMRASETKYVKERASEFERESGRPREQGSQKASNLKRNKANKWDRDNEQK